MFMRAVVNIRSPVVSGHVSSGQCDGTKSGKYLKKVANICAGQKVITTDWLDEKWGPPSGMMFIAYSL